MTNPARLLLSVLDGWVTDAHQSLETTRGIDTTLLSLQGWRTQWLAVESLRSIAEQLELLQREGAEIAAFNEALPSWYAAVFNFHLPFRNTDGSRRSPFPAGSRAVLQSLIPLLDVSQITPTLDEDAIDSIRASLDDVLDVLGQDRSLPTAERRYVWGLVQAARDALETWRDFGDIEIRDLVQRASSATLAATATVTASNPTLGARLFRSAYMMASKVVVKVFTTEAQRGVEAIGGAIQRAIESGAPH